MRTQLCALGVVLIGVASGLPVLVGVAFHPAWALTLAFPLLVIELGAGVAMRADRELLVPLGKLLGGGYLLAGSLCVITLAVLDSGGGRFAGLLTWIGVVVGVPVALGGAGIIALVGIGSERDWREQLDGEPHVDPSPSTRMLLGVYGGAALLAMAFFALVYGLIE